MEKSEFDNLMKLPERLRKQILKDTDDFRAQHAQDPNVVYIHPCFKHLQFRTVYGLKVQYLACAEIRPDRAIVGLLEP